MTQQRFQVSTNRTGIHRVIRVVLFATQADMAAAYADLGDDSLPESFVIEGGFIPRDDWDDRDPRPWQGTIWLALEGLTMVAITHEATHAAMHLYSIDCYRDHARASAHLHSANETVPYLVCDIAATIALRVGRLTDVPLDIGNPRYYADPEHPPTLGRA